MFILCKTSIPSDKAQAIPADTGKTIKPTSVIETVIEVDVVPIKTIVSIDSKTVFRVS